MPHGAIALAKHAPKSGARVLDLGCGAGDTTLDLGRLVGPRGTVVGLDACEASLRLASDAARAAKAANVTFYTGDAESSSFDGELSGFDVVFSRFGTMSLRAPTAALRNLRSALKPGGRLIDVTWRSVDPHVRRMLLEGAGFTEIAFEAIDVQPRGESVGSSSWIITATCPVCPM
ncbi:MAG: SAM-dependent methyltransferase [Labilithrix sp.]|nr:SAM-dependent methyltransferase [Labilithrix sp.]